MSNIQIFANPEFGEIRSVEINGEPWLVGKDVAAALGYAKPLNALATHIDEDDSLKQGLNDSMGRMQETILINESGLYSLILSSKLPSAKKFKRWVTSEVLPSIRKHGAYVVPEMTEHEKMQVETQRESVMLEKARLLNQIAEGYEGDYKQVLQAYVTKELVGDFVLPLPKLEEKTYSAGEIGKLLGISGNKVGRLAIKHNLKTNEYGLYFHDKAKGCNKEIQSFRYYEKVVPVLKELLKNA